MSETAEKTNEQELKQTWDNEQRAERAEKFRATLNEPNKFLFKQRICIEIAELLTVDTSELKFEKSQEDIDFNNELMKNASTDLSSNIATFIKDLESNENLFTESVEYHYSTASTRNESDCEESPEKNVRVHAINLNDAPPEIREVLKKIASGITNRKQTVSAH